MTQRLLSKLLAGLLGAFIGLSLTAVAQVPGPVNLRGLGGDSIQEVQAPNFGTGGSFSYIPEVAVASCTGCTTYMQGSYVVHAFSTVGNTHTFTAPTGLTEVEVVIIGGGGGGGGDRYGGGGGGAGGYVPLPNRAVAQNTPLNVTVGDGGAGGVAANGKGQDGSPSAFDGTVANGGGGGGAGNQTTATGAGNTGGSGGGGGARDSNTGVTQAGAAGNQGNDGFNGRRNATDDNNWGGGGGGAGGDATTGTDGNGGQGSPGGAGVDLSASFGTSFGVAGWFAAGGGGGKRQNGTGGPGGQGGGGTGGVNDNGGGNAVDGTGSGGGGAGGDNADQPGGDGGSGIVLVRYIPQPTGAMRAVHVFTANDTFTPPAGLTQVEVLVVAGGGGGGFPADRTGGGGGAGGLIHNTAFAVGGPIAVTVGAGGNAGVDNSGATAGGNSVFSSLTAIGGGRGGTNGVVATTGGSGGGGYHNAADSGKAGTVGQGNAGGSGYDSGNTAIGFKAGGGGGAGGAGTTATAAVDGAGGAGALYAISGTAQFYAGGGAGGMQVYTGTVPGGSGVGGSGGTNGAGGTAGAANTGSGGGGGSRNLANSITGNGGAGGSGIVIVSYVPPTTTYITHTFTTTGASSFTPPPGVSSVEVLVVGGGGGGGSSIPFGDGGSGGGGAGGVVYNSSFGVTAGVPVSVTVGAGGAGGDDPGAHEYGANGSNSVFGSLTALGGGGGAGGNAAGSDGGSGGGSRGANGGLGNQPGSPSGGFGNRGGNIPGSVAGAPGSGGGGAGGAAPDLTGNTVGETGHNGGIGQQYSISGTLTYYAGGGGGGTAQNRSAVSQGGLGGGGAGGRTDTPATAGTANTGGGGGGGNDAIAGAAGGSGIVIVRYRPPTLTLTQQPSNTVISGNALAQQPQVLLRDYQNNPISGVNITSAVDFGTATLGGTTTVATNGSGIAAFSNLAPTGSGNTIRLGFTAANTNPAQKVVSNNIDLVSLHLEITHATSYSVCSPSVPITVTVRDSNANVITNFAGTVTLTNSSGQGTYSGSGVTNTGAGQAQYTFTGSEGGVKVFNYATTALGTTTFNATSGTLVTENYATSLTAELCRIRIAFPNSPATTCAAEDVTLTVVNAAGATLTDFAGTITLTTSTNQGAWANGNGNGTFTPGPGNGTASYTFGAESSPGSVTLQLFHPNAGTVNVTANIGVYTDAPGFDPNLTVTACSAGITMGAPQCYNNATNGNVTIVPRTTSNTRMVVLTAGSANGISGSATAGAIAPPVSSATVFNGTSNVPMTLVDRAFWNINGNTDVRTEMWAILDANLAAAGGNYNVIFNGNNSGTAPTSICVYALSGVEQEIPQTPDQANNFEANGAGAITAAITTLANNSMVISAVSVRKSSTTATFNFGALDTDLDPATRTRVGGFATTNLGFGGSYGLDLVAGFIDINETLSVSAGTIDRRAHVLAGFRPDAPKLNHFRITHNGTGGTCAPNAVTITAVDQYGAVLTNYTGTVTLSAGGAGSWGQGTATNVPANGMPGIATYAFHANDNGVAQLNYSNTGTGLVNFNVVAGLIQESPFYDTSLNLQACEMRLSHANADGSTCAVNTVTLGIYTPGVSGVLVNYTGTVTLNTVLVPGPGGGAGDWSVLDGDGTFDNATANDGIATYTFHNNDGGEVTLGYSKTAASTVNFNPVASGLVVASGYDANLVLTNCFFRISHDGSGDVCTPELVTISVVNGTGVQQANYVGNLNLTTPTGSGDWSVANAVNPISNLGSGAASYTFADTDDGDIQLYLRHHAKSESGFVIGANSGSFGVQGGFNPTLLVAGCTIRFSVSDPSGQTCSSTQVTVGIYNSGGTLATSYTGAIALSTSTSHGSWVSTTGPGSLSNNAPNTGLATYTFVAGDAGDAVIEFTNNTVETLNFNANSAGLHPANAIVVDTGDPAYDPDLEISACLPGVAASACYQNQSQANAITLLSSAEAQGSRMVLIYVGSETTTAASNMAFEGQLALPSLLRTQSVNSGGVTLTLQVYGLLDAHLPQAAGAYDVSFTGPASSAMCIVSVTGVAQAFPQANPAPGDQLNGTGTTTTTNRVETSLTVPKNNSLVVGVALSSLDGNTYYTNLDERMWAPAAADPTGTDWVGDYEYHLVASTTTAIHQNTGADAGRRQAQIALVLDPVADGPPGEGNFVPVTLFETFSGRVDYIAIGNTVRADGPDGGTTVSACEMPESGGVGLGANTTGTTRGLPLPTGATIRAAYLYWAGSGTESDIDNQVRFGVDGGSRPVLTADRVFRIKPMKYDPQFDVTYNGVVAGSFFAAYKDVTGLITTTPGEVYRFSDLTIRINGTWATSSSCTGGWSLVVVYEHPSEDLNVINLFHGFQPFWHSSLTLIPRNFRMATPDGIDRPHAQVTHVTFEGDSGITSSTEVLGLQNNPVALTFTNLTNGANPSNNQYNGTFTYPNYNGSLDFNGTYTSETDGQDLGVDVDTYYVEGDDPGEHLEPFGALEAEQITTHYETGQDLVLLTAEFISVMNSPIADLEVFVSDSGNFKVGLQNTATYQYSVVNNGDGADGGFANGDVILTGNMPTGITIDNIAGAGWNCSLATATAFTCVFDIATSWTTGLGAATNGQLAKDEALPLVTVTIDITNETQFPLLDNEVTTVARLAHVGNYATCPAAPAGVQPSPNPVGGCSRAPQFDNVNDLNKYLVDIDDLIEKSITNNNVHHIDTNIRGVETNLGITKTLVGILEANEPATYTVTVTNSGPDVTTKVMTVTDTLPPGLVPFSASGTGWTCGISVQTVTCTRAAALGVGATTPAITIVTNDIVAPAVEGAPVSNTATVAAGQYNFDAVPGNDFDIETAIVTGPLAASNEKFLLSVTEDGSTLGGLLFDAGDLVIYDPVTDTAVMYIDEDDIPGATSLGNIDAVHLLPNGHVLLSTATDGSTINGLTFNAEDIVMYDPILHTVTLVFDGSAIFSSDSADIDAIHVLYNNSYTPSSWVIVLSTTDTATIGALTFQDNDIVGYNMGTGIASLRADGNDNDLFNGPGGDISALHLRNSDSDIYVVSTSDASATIGIIGENQEYERGELVEIDLNVANSPQTDPLFCDNVIPCEGAPPAIFTPASTTRRLDAVHVIESGYMGHFSVSSSGGDVCTQTQVTIRKHAGLTHTSEGHYRGTIIISNNLNDGNWVKDINSDGTLVPLGGSDTGRAMYTFAASDAGEVVLYITDTVASNNFNVDVRTIDLPRETTTRENAPSEDPNIVIGQLVTPITYSDQFSSVSYTNNDGAAQFAAGWAETNDDGLANNGKIRITSNQLRFNNSGGGGAPEILRQIDFSAYGVQSTPTLSFDWTIIGSPTGTFVAEARGNNSDVWTQLWTTSATSGSGTSGAVPFTGLTLSATTQIRFRIVSGYNTGLPASQYIAVDNVTVATETNDCGVGGTVDHYAITHDGTMLSCLAELITITPHANGDLVVEPGLGTVITLQTSTNKGFWGPPTNGNGTFATPSTDNGFATYAFLDGEMAVTFPFYYTELADDVDPNVETVTITVADNNVPTATQLENSTLTVAKTGLRFFNETANSEQFPTLVAGMPSTVFPAQVLTMQAVRSSDSNPGVCEPAFANGTDVAVELAFECDDPATCSGTTIPVQVTNNSNTVSVEPVDDDGQPGVNPGGFVSMPLRFTTNGTFSRAVIGLNYGDAGALQIHGRHNIVVEDEDGDPLNSNDYMVGSGDTFVVRPFAFDIDFTLDRQNANGNCTTASSCAADANGSVFGVAGAGFNTTVRAVAWQAADDDSSANGDVPNDGVPDSDADLFDNTTTPNFGNEAVATEDNVTLTHQLAAVMPMGSVTGALTDFTFTDFGAGGSQMHSVRYSEVGIIDLIADLDSDDYLGGQQGVTGRVRNVGRFIPADFAVTAPMLTARPLFTPNAADFTYMGEEFTVAFTLTARNSGGVTTANYFGDFAKLTTPAQLDFRAVFDGGLASDTSYSTRLSKVVGGPNAIPNDYEGNWDEGQITLSGNLVFGRLANGTPDGPFGPLKIAVRATDSDSVIDADRDVTEDVMACDPDCMMDPKEAPYANLIGTHEFRYGRLRLQNGYGSDIPDFWDHDDDDDGLNPTPTPEVPLGRDVMVRVVAEYFDGTNFVTNEDDVATPYDSDELDFVPNTFTGNLTGSTAPYDANDEPAITDSSGKVYAGATMETSGQTDVPLYLRAPLVEGNDGTALIELDLDALGLSFLKFDWRDGTGTGDDLEADVKADPNDYSTPDNPRALIEFGTFRGNDRIINWQEIFE